MPAVDRVCIKCLRIKELSCFSRTTGKASQVVRYDRTCRTCRSALGKVKRDNDEAYRIRRLESTKSWRKKNPEKVKQQRQSTKMYTAAQYYDYFRTHPCAHCGETDPLKLEVDHIEPLHNRKAKAERANWFQLLRDLKEKSGLQVLCANCHAVKTHKENNTSRWQIHRLRGRDS